MKDSIKSFIAFLFFFGWLGNVIFAQSSYKEIEVRNGGTITGFVLFESNRSAIQQYPITKDHAVCGKTKPAPRLTLGKNKGVKNTIIYLEGIKEGKAFSVRQSFILNQQQCDYNPHVLILPRGANLDIVNSDPILHNVHAYSTVPVSRSIFNIAQPIRGQRTTIKEKQFASTSMLVATCDAGHPWMSAYIMIADQPYVTVTDDAGAFTLDQVPPGTYKLTMWHEGVQIIRAEMEGTKVKKYYFEEPYQDSREIVVRENGTINTNFTLTLREPTSVSGSGND